MADTDDDLVIQIEITSNRGRVGKTALAIKLAQAVKNLFPEIEVVLEDDGHCVRKRLLDDAIGDVIANKIRIVDNPPHDEADYRNALHDTDVIPFLVLPEPQDVCIDIETYITVDLLKGIPCGKTMGHGDSCVAREYCCDGCSARYRAADKIRALVRDFKNLV